jgi:methanogenic corrinoid protein MtbC1
MYLLHLLQRDQDAAAQLVFEAHREGKSIPEIYEHILRPALAEVGRMWHVQEATVADEHYCTAATQVIMSQLRALARESAAPSPKMHRRRVLATSVGGDLHEVGIRMVADLFELAGWHAEYLGPNMPTDEILAVLADDDGRPAFDLLALSANTTLSVRSVADLIRAVREHPSFGSIPILVGGTPFLLVPDLWQVVGADAFAADAPGSIAVAERLVASRR